MNDQLLLMRIYGVVGRVYMQAIAMLRSMFKIELEEHEITRLVINLLYLSKGIVFV